MGEYIGGEARLPLGMSAGSSKTKCFPRSSNSREPRSQQPIQARDNMSTSRDDRPTFGTYWKKNKENSTVKGLVFVQSDPGQSSSKGMLKQDSLRSARAVGMLLIFPTQDRVPPSCAALIPLLRTWRSRTLRDHVSIRPERFVNSLPAGRLGRSGDRARVARRRR